jgi:hypothetical protein
MSFVLTFSKYKPSPRQDGLLWTQVVIQQAAVADPATGEPGSWTTIDTKAIAGYPDPTDPPTLSFTTEQATLVPGWYRVIFQDATGDQELTMPRLFSGVTFRPSTRDVALYVKNRTVDKFNNFLGDFKNGGVTNGGTAVSADEVEGLIEKAEQRVLRLLDVDPNVPIPTESQAAVTDAMALYAAMLVEITKYSEQIQRQTSPYPQLKELWDDLWPALQKDINPTSAVPTSSGIGLWDIVATGTRTAQGTFPETDEDKITYKTAF